MQTLNIMPAKKTGIISEPFEITLIFQSVAKSTEWLLMCGGYEVLQNVLFFCERDFYIESCW